MKDAFEFTGGKRKMLFIAEKESFIVRVLVKKAAEADADCELVPCTVNAINSKLEGISLITFFMEANARPQSDVLHFLNEKMEERGIKMIVIADQADMPAICDNISGDLIYKSFPRPVDNAEYIRSISEYFRQVASGEFKKSILIVDDDPQYLSLVREWLKADTMLFLKL